MEVKEVLKQWNKGKLTLKQLNVLALIVENLNVEYKELKQKGEIDNETIAGLKEKGYIIGYWKELPIPHKKVLNLFNIELDRIKQKVYTKSQSKVCKPSTLINTQANMIVDVIYEYYPVSVNTGKSSYATAVMKKPLKRRLTELIEEYPDYIDILNKATRNDVIRAVKKYCGISNKTKMVSKSIVTASNFVATIKDGKSREIINSPLVIYLENSYNKQRNAAQTNDGLLA